VGSVKKESIDINILYKGESDLFDMKLNLHSIEKSRIAEKN